MTEREKLLQRFKQLKADYIRAFKGGFISVCRKIGDQLASIAAELRNLGETFEGLGLSADGEYIVRCIDSARNHPSDHTQVFLNDAERLLDEAIPITRFTMRGFETFKIADDGTLSMVEPEAAEQPAKIEKYFPPTRNSDIQAKKR